MIFTDVEKVKAKGLDASREFYREFGEEMLDRLFPDSVSAVAVGLCGSGSDCFGFDDDVSKDHDCDPGFMIFLPGSEVVDEKLAFRIERGYDGLPKTFRGMTRKPAGMTHGRRGPVSLAAFLGSRIGTDDVPSAAEWLTIPENYLAEVTNGELFRDDSGIFTGIRRRLCNPPRDVLLKKTAGCLFVMSQSGLYNYERCLSRGDADAARLSCFEFFRCAANAFFWLSGAYMPYYKWTFRAMRNLPEGERFAGLLSEIISGRDVGSGKKEAIDLACGTVISMTSDKLCPIPPGMSLIDAAYYLNEKTADPNLRNLHVLYGVK